MKIWETHLEIMSALMEPAQARLKTLGLQGWELVQIGPPYQQSGNTGDSWVCNAWFKREIVPLHKIEPEAA